MCKDENVRIVIKQSAGVPTIPVSADHRNGDWITTDIYEGEQYQDTDTGIVYTRSSTGIEAVGGGGGATNVLATTIVNIGDWDMDATDSISVAHGIADFTKIRDISVIIRNDGGTPYHKLDQSFFGGTQDGSVVQFDATNVSLYRTASGTFDSADFDSTSFKRGYITIQHIP